MTKPHDDWTSSLTDGDLEDVFGAVEQSAPKRAAERPPLRIVDEEWAPEPPPAEELPSADELASEQYIAGVYRMHEDTSNYPHFPWKPLDDLAGAMCPEDLVLVAARTGGGKSLFLQNLFGALVEQGRFGLYCGLEQSAHILRIKWACMKAGVPPKLILAPRKEERNTKPWHDAMTAVQQWYKWQFEPPRKQRAFFSAERKINRHKLRQWTQWAVDHGCDFVVIDHIDRVEHGDGRNPFHEMSETIRLAKELAVEHRIVMLLASQLGRPGDPLENFMPPDLHKLRGGGTKEEEADTVLGIYRPLRADVTTEDLQAVRRGMRNVKEIREPNTMGVMMLKHRLDGPVAGEAVLLGVDRGIVFDPRRQEKCAQCRVTLARVDTHPTLCTPCAHAAA